MLFKLKLKFIALNMAMVTVVLLLGFGSVCIATYNHDYDNANQQLTLAIEQTATEYSMDLFNSKSAEPLHPNKPGVPKIGGPEDSFQYENIAIACFILTQDGQLTTAHGRESSAIISEEVLKAAGVELKKLPDGIGTLNTLRLVYKKQAINTTKFVAFADISTVSKWSIIAQNLIVIGLLILGLFLIISIFFSKWAIKPIVETWEKQKQFVADASHDLKTPLTVIMANNSILMSQPKKTVEEQKQWITSSQAESSRMLNLINNMLTLARIDDENAIKKEIKKSFEVFNISQLIEGVVLEFESVAFDSNIKMISEIEPNLFINANKIHIEKMASTLLENACKHAGKNETITIKLYKPAKSLQVKLSVNNKIALIDPKDLPHIFERFYRSDKSRTQDSSNNQQQSHGLGLAIAESIAKECGGGLTAQSTPEQGTTFTATFLAAKPIKHPKTKK